MIDDPAIGVTCGIVRLKLHGPVEISQSFLVLLQVFVKLAAVVVGDRVLGIQLNGLAEIVDCTPVIVSAFSGAKC